MIEIRIKPDAKPIDNITKFAWDNEDYIEVEVPDPPRPEPEPMPEGNYVTYDELDKMLKAGVNSI